MPVTQITPLGARTARRQIASQRARGFTVELGWPASELMQNRHDGRHWSYAAVEKASARREGYLASLAAMTQCGYEPPECGTTWRVVMLFTPPDRRRRDVSNLHAAMKAALDGISDALGFDDSHFIEHTQRMSAPEPRARVTVTLQEI
jgi:crossover junction endodeoxyribonuclease RusA